MVKKILLILLVLVIGAGVFVGYYRFDFYRNPKVKSPVVARVGNSVLTVEDIQKHIPAEYSDFVTYEQNVDYVKRWIDGEILYQNALIRKIEQEPAVKRRLEKMRKDLLMSEMISRLCTQGADVSDADIEKYYQENGNRYLRKETEVKFAHICMRTQAETWKVRDRITADNFYTLARESSIEPVEDSITAPYLTKAQVMPELADIIFDIKIGGTTPPIRTPMGYYIVKILDKQMAGSVKPLKSVREEIVSQISTRSQKVRLDEMIAQLRSRLKVEYNLSMVPGKSEVKPAEAAPAPAPAPAPAAPMPAPTAAKPQAVRPIPAADSTTAQ